MAAFNELFHDREVYGYWDTGWTCRERNANPVGFLKALYSGALTRGHKTDVEAIGFKLMPQHWTRGPFDALVGDPRIKKIILP